MKKGLTIYGIIMILFILYGIYLNQPNSTIPTDPVLIEVEIKGGILLPGTYQVSPSDTLEDLIDYAGGFSQNAIKDEIELDEVLRDQAIYIIEEDVPATKININTATKEELQTINGIGPVTAEAIITYRIKNGPFIYLEDLMKVNNIGEKTYEKIKDFITL
ncbi:MAG: ComEA family DNA-binding protein [Acholeplasmataceae bacterium]|nr:ComEA family DNA-binding protein [Acholeplasmataceae bacterium]